jgi:hypothetical protein
MEILLTHQPDLTFVTLKRDFRDQQFSMGPTIFEDDYLSSWFSRDADQAANQTKIMTRLPERPASADLVSKPATARNARVPFAA